MEYWDLYDCNRQPLNRVHARGEKFAEGEYYVSCIPALHNYDFAISGVTSRSL